MSCLQRDLIDSIACDDIPHRADGVRPGDRVVEAHKIKERAGDIGERKRLPVDHKASGEHPILDDEIAHKLPERGARPSDEAFAGQKPPPPFTLLERLAIVKVRDEIDELLDLFADREEFEARARKKAWEGADLLEGDLDGVLHGAREFRHEAVVYAGEVAVDMDRAAKGDERGDALRPPIGRDLITKHPALAISGEMNVAAGDLAHSVDRVVHGEDMIVERAL